MSGRREGKKDPVKTSVTIARKVWEDAQVYAIRSGLTFTEVVQAALKKYLERIEEDRKRNL